MEKSVRPNGNRVKAVPSAEVTTLLRAWTGGDRGALDRLTPMVYEELRRLARYYLRGERAGHSLQTTALVNEALTCGWWITSACSARTARISSRSRRR